MKDLVAQDHSSEKSSAKILPLRKGSCQELVPELQHLMGYPLYREELIINFYSDDRLTVTLTRTGLEWSWTDRKSEDQDLEGATTNYRGTADLRNLKDKLIFFAKWGGNECNIAIAPVFVFSDRSDDFMLEVRPSGLMGETVSITGAGACSNVQGRFAQDVLPSVQKYAQKEPYASTVLQASRNDLVIHRIGERPLLDTRILEFCEHNGILSHLEGPKTYRQLLESKGNDYGRYGELFARLTGTQLLSTEQHCELPEKPAVSMSLIIPCYNVDSTIFTTLASIAAQDLPKAYFKNLEVVLVDDGSRVPLETILRGKDFGFKTTVLRLTENHGVSHARALGVTESQGEILMFIDGDVVLSKEYLRDHLVRNLIIDNAVFVSFREHVTPDDRRLSPAAIGNGIDLPDYSGDQRIKKIVESNSNGAQTISTSSALHLLEDTNYFKGFHGSRVVGIKTLPSMVHGHNCSVRRELVLAADPFDRRFIGWGKEDFYFGLKMISAGNFIVPVLSCGVLHIDHPPRSGSPEAQQREYKMNVELLDRLLNERV
jgi:glycosyltransferase involved in cell wall biosynthesis